MPSPLFVQSNIIPVNMLYFKTVSSIMHDVSNNLTSPKISTLFAYSNNTLQKIHEALLKVLSLEDTYVDVSSLVSKLLQYS